LDADEAIPSAEVAADIAAQSEIFSGHNVPSVDVSLAAFYLFSLFYFYLFFSFSCQMYLGIDKIFSFFSELKDALVCLAFVRFVIISSRKDEDFNLLTADRNWLYVHLFLFLKSLKTLTLL